jgi:hypothetical protein
MIQVQELRIGNLVSLRGEIVTVKGIGINSALHERGENPAGDLEGIPITEEWLLKFGFTFVSAPSFYGFDCNKKFNGGVFRGAFLRTSSDKGFYYLGFLVNGTHKKVKYIHQLQNLFYCLTGEELSLK